MTRTTLYDVAQRAGVSIASVSFAFHHPSKLKPETRELILRAADDLGYVPNGSARGLARGKTGVFGLFSFDMLLAHRLGEHGSSQRTHDPLAFPLYRDEVQRGVELECLARGYGLLLERGDTQNDLFNITGRVDGLALFPGKLPEESILRMAQRIPIVLISRESIGTNTFGVMVDNAAGIDAVVEHMIQVHGARSFGFLGTTASYDYAARLSALQHSLSSRNISPPAAPIDPVDLSIAQAFDNLEGLVRARALPDVLVCASDQIAVEVLRYLQQAAVEVPQQTIVVGFDGILAGCLTDPTISTVTQPFELIGRTAISMLHACCRGETPDTNVVLPVTLTPRGSCGCPANAVW